MNSQNNFPVIARDYPVSVASPVIPLNFIYPGLSLAQILSIFKAYRFLSFFIFLIVLAITVVVMTILPRTYMATVTLMVNYEVNDPLNGKELPVGQVGSYIATQVELMQTPEVLLAVVDRLKLTENETYARGYRGESGTLREWVAKKVAKNTSVYQGQMGSQLIYVTYSARNPVEAAQVANTVADVYKDQDHIRSTGPPGERAKRYAQQIDELKKKVNHAQQQVTAFRQQNGLIDEGAKTNFDVALLTTLEGRLLDAQNARRAAEARESADPGVNESALSSNLVQSLKTEIAAMESKMAELLVTYTPQYPEVSVLKSKIESTRRSLASALKSYSSSATSNLTGILRLEENLLRSVANQRSNVLTKNLLNDEAAKYQLELESAQTVYKRALEGYDQIMFASGGHYTNVSFVSRATPPVKASTPKLLKGLVLGGVVALILGFGIPLSRELFHRRVRCRDDIERQHGVPVLMEFGALPMRTSI